MKQQVVYFIQRGADGPIKIGTTTYKLTARLRDIQIGSPDPLYLIGHILGSEKDTHIRFKKYHISGEWFEPHEDILHFVRLNRLRPPPNYNDALPMPLQALRGPLREALEQRRQKLLTETGIEGTASAIVRTILERELLGAASVDKY
jgi:hypothetical protein